MREEAVLPLVVEVTVNPVVAGGVPLETVPVEVTVLSVNGHQVEYEVSTPLTVVTTVDIVLEV